MLLVLHPLQPIVSTSELCLLPGSHPASERTVLVSKRGALRGHLPCGPAAAQLQQPPLLGIEILRSRGTEGASVSDPAQALPWVVNAWRASGSLAQGYCFLHTMQLFVRTALCYPSQQAVKHPDTMGDLFRFSWLNVKLTVPVAMPGKRWTDRNQWLERLDLRAHSALSVFRWRNACLFPWLLVFSPSVLLTEWGGRSPKHSCNFPAPLCSWNWIIYHKGHALFF